MEDKELISVLFVSRNKDNKHIENFKQRSKSFVTTRTVEELQSKFKDFVRNGLSGEFSRMYVSINPRSNNKTQKELMHKLIDGQINMSKLPQIIASIASKKENIFDSKNIKWLFDFDVYNQDVGLYECDLENFIDDIIWYYKNTSKKSECEEINIETYKTPNGFAIIVDKRFDTRELLNTWGNVELKRDSYLCVNWSRNN